MDMTKQLEKILEDTTRAARTFEELIVELEDLRFPDAELGPKEDRVIRYAQELDTGSLQILMAMPHLAISHKIATTARRTLVKVTHIVTEARRVRRSMLPPPQPVAVSYSNERLRTQTTPQEQAERFAHAN